MEWSSLYCPNRECRCYGLPFVQGMLVRNGSSHGAKQGLCRACGWRVSLTEGTAYFNLESERPVFELAVRALAEGLSLRSTARVVQVDKDTVCAWLRRAGSHSRLLMLYLWRRLHVTECQLDELWSFVHTKEQHLLQATEWAETYGDAWIWVAFAPCWRLVLAFVVGKRTQTEANLLLQRVVHVTDAHIPFFTSDQLPAYETALLHAYGTWYQPPRQGSRGRYPAKRRVPPPELRYAQVVKRRERGHVVEVSRKVVFGTAEEVEAWLATSPVSTTINTSFVERDNLRWRTLNRRLTRKALGFSKDVGWLELQLWLSMAYYHLCLPHLSLREALPSPEPTRGTGSARKWRDVTPAMAAGITDHVWTTEELLGFRLPATFLDELPEIEPLFPIPNLSVT